MDATSCPEKSQHLSDHIQQRWRVFQNKGSAVPRKGKNNARLTKKMNIYKLPFLLLLKPQRTSSTPEAILTGSLDTQLPSSSWHSLIQLPRLLAHIICLPPSLFPGRNQTFSSFLCHRTYIQSTCFRPVAVFQVMLSKTAENVSLQEDGHPQHRVNGG